MVPFSAGQRTPSAGDQGRSARGAALARLLDTRRLIDTTLDERPRIAVTDRPTGTLLALTDSTDDGGNRVQPDPETIRPAPPSADIPC